MQDDSVTVVVPGKKCRVRLKNIMSLGTGAVCLILAIEIHCLITFLLRN